MPYFIDRTSRFGNTRRLDELLDGGFCRGACALLAGLPGTGKTILATTFAAASCARIDRIETLAPRHGIVDAISACPRMGGRQAAFEYLMRRLNACKERGITVLFVNQLSGADDYLEISGNEISSMIDTVVFLGYQHHPGETNRVIEVLKSRGSRHSNQKREYVIRDHGIDILDAYLGEGGVLTGTLRRRQEDRDRLEVQRLAYEIEAKELELKRLRLAHAQALQSVAPRGQMPGDPGASRGRSPDDTMPPRPAAGPGLRGRGDP